MLLKNIWNEFAFAGHGVKAHRCLKAICEMIGIKNIECSVEGSTSNYRNMTKAFFNGLAKEVRVV